jgi:sigma-54 specific flagellar transcriptional regulator A
MSDSRILVVEADDARAERIGALLDFLDFTPKRIGAVDELDLARAKPRDWLAIVVGGVEDLEDFRRFGGWLSKSPLHPPLLVLPALHGLTEQLGVHPEQVWTLDWPLRHPQLEGHLRRASLQALRGEERSERDAGPEGQSEGVRRLRRMIEQVAPFDTTVLILGESGTGKELCADALHRFSKRAKGPFIAVNCAAIPRDMLESELFGHAKGAFTGAVADRKGAVLSAQGGTLFLDEICEMDLALQTKLLRFLQTMTVQRLGEDQVRQADVRIVCATNKDPRSEVAASRLREDLFYRLHVLPVEMPPLRDRGDDVLLIARAFLERFAAEEGKTCSIFSAEAEAALIRFAWPGNVRQLQNLIRNLVVFSQGTVIELADLPAELRPKTGERLLGRVTLPLPSALPSFAPAGTEDGEKRPLVSLDEAIRLHVEAAIAMCGGSIPRAAAMLEVAPSTIYRRIEAWQAADALQVAT